MGHVKTTRDCVIEKNTGTKVERFKPIPGPYEPWYVVRAELSTNKAIKKRWECPHCGAYFKARNTCEDHCKGKQGMFGPLCSETKRGGKCYNGCEHP
jgi:hypothetical protein